MQYCHVSWWSLCGLACSAGRYLMYGDIYCTDFTCMLYVHFFCLVPCYYLVAFPLLLCYLVTPFRCSLVTLCYLVTLLPCCCVALLPCCSVPLLPRYLVTLFPCHSVTLLPCYSVTLLPCCSVALLLCFLVPLLLCSLVTLLLLPVNRGSTVAKAVVNSANFNEDMTVAVVTACWNLTLNWSAPSDRALSIAPLYIKRYLSCTIHSGAKRRHLLVTRTGSCSRQLVCILLCHSPLHHHPSAK